MLLHHQKDNSQANNEIFPTCTPNTSSEGCLLTRAHSLGSPCSKLLQTAISPQVMSAPKDEQFIENQTVDKQALN